METVYKYILIFLVVILLFISFRYYILHNEYKDLNVSYIELQRNFAIEKFNGESLRNIVKEQNIYIENYKKSSSEYENLLDDLNKEIIKQNMTEPSYENSEKKQATSEEAIQWLREKASSLVLY